MSAERLEALREFGEKTLRADTVVRSELDTGAI